MALTCPHCNKTYKATIWLDKHISINHPAPVTNLAPEPLTVTSTVLTPTSGHQYKNIKSMSLEEKAQYIIQLLDKAIVTRNPDATLHNNIFSNQFKNSPFYYIRLSEDTCKHLLITYKSPQEKALTEKGTNIALALERLGYNGNTYKSYGSLPFNILSSNWKEDNHLFEILGEERKPYFDIEFRYKDDSQTATQLALIHEVIRTAFLAVNVTIIPQEHFAVCYNIGICKQGTFAGLKKVSYHIIVNNGTKFANPEDANKFCAKYIHQHIASNPDYAKLHTEEGLSIDTAVYTKNRLFKLPYQSKANDKRPQKPDTRYAKQELTDFLISYNIANYTPINISSIVLEYEAQVRRIRERIAHLNIRGSNINFNAIDQYLQDAHEVNYKQDIPGDVSVSIPYLVKSIYNGKSISYLTWFYVGSAIKRCIQDYDKATELFWQWTQKYNSHILLETVRARLDTFVNDRCGFKTLLSLACLCNDKLATHIQKPWLYLFKIDTLPDTALKITVNKRYINYNDFLQLDTEASNLFTKSTYFIKSPMGTGKTYNFNQYIRKIEDILLTTDLSTLTDIRIIYLSSKRAFAEAMEQEFQSIGFINYMKTHDIWSHKRIIISVESLRRLSSNQIDNNTILIIDEAESIFNIVSSHTLATNDLLINLNTLYKLIQSTPKVFVMDAFLSNRSIEPIIYIRGTLNIFYYQNDYKYPQRQVHMLDKDEFAKDIITSLSNRNRCVAVVGSRKYGQEIINNVPSTVNYKYYTRENPLNLSTVVNQEWSTLDLLMYSPTITCGISYDNPASKFDKLYIYAVNKGSCHFRDVIQAHKRVREFTNPEIAICLNTEYKQFHNDMQPIFKDEIVELYTSVRAQLFFDEDTPASIKELTNLAWVTNIHAHNILEQNIHQIYLEQVAQCFFEQENIIPITKTNTYEIQLTLNTSGNDWTASTIPDIDYNEFIRIYLALKAANLPPSLADYQKYIKYIFRFRTGPKYTDELFNAWHTETQRQYIDNIKSFKELLFKGFTSWSQSQPPGTPIEYIEIRSRAYKVILSCFTDLFLLTPGPEPGPKHILDLTKGFTTLQFTAVAERLKDLDSRAINQLFTTRYHDFKNGSIPIELTTKTATSILNKLVQDYFNYKIVKVGSRLFTIAGTRQKISKYVIKPIETEHCLISALKDTIEKIIRETEIDVS